MADVKGQVWRGTPVEQAADQRKSTGAFKGAAEGDHHSTIKGFEFRVPDDQVAEWIERADQFNRLVSDFTYQQPSMFGQIANVFGLEGSGPVNFGFRVYDND